MKGSRQEAANRARRHTPINIRWRRQAYGRGLPEGRRPCRLGSDSDTSSRLPHKEHETHIQAQGSEYMPVPDFAPRVFQTQRWRQHDCTQGTGRARVGPDRDCSRRLGRVEVTSGKTTREQVECEHTSVTQLSVLLLGCFVQRALPQHIGSGPLS